MNKIKLFNVCSTIPSMIILEFNRFGYYLGLNEALNGIKDNDLKDEYYRSIWSVVCKLNSNYGFNIRDIGIKNGNDIITKVKALC